MRTHTHTHTHTPWNRRGDHNNKKWQDEKSPKSWIWGAWQDQWRHNSGALLSSFKFVSPTPAPGITATSLKQTTVLSDLKSLHWRTHLHAVRAVPDDAAGVLVWPEGCCPLMLVKRPVARLLLALWYLLPGLLLGDSTVLVLFAISWVIYEWGKKKLIS